MQASNPRPKYAPRALPSVLQPDDTLDVLTFEAPFSSEAFQEALLEIIHHPERNSSIILRADILDEPSKCCVEDPTEITHERSFEPKLNSDLTNPPASSSQITLDHPIGVSRHDAHLNNGGHGRWDLQRTIIRRILPNRPTRDSPLVQDCRIYARRNHEDGRSIKVVMDPRVQKRDELPFYHPGVKQVIFRYEPQTQSSVGKDAVGGSEDEHGEPADDLDAPKNTSQASSSGAIFAKLLESSRILNQGSESTRDVAVPKAETVATPVEAPLQHRGSVTISVLPFAEDPEFDKALSCGSSETTEKSLSNRMYRTCLHLGDTVHRFGWGKSTGYQKRMRHDILVDRSSFQDLYLIMKERHRHLDSRKDKPGFNKIEDKKRHVWKDVAVACFLMLLWRDMYPARPNVETTEKELGSKVRDWETWGRPSGGFLDIGCGYDGIGLELRARRTWPTYPPETQAALKELAVNPLDWFPSGINDWENGSGQGRCVVKEGMFLIGNHADEMTPWIPLFSLLPQQPVPYISLPCCLHTLNGQFNRLNFEAPYPHPGLDSAGDLSKGLEEGQSRYKAYLMWLGWSGLMCGWKWETEVLRIPSTKNWAIIGKERWTRTAEELSSCRLWALEQIEAVRRSGGFSAREKEGNPH